MKWPVAASALAILLLGATGCRQTTSSSPAPGVIAGIAAHCAGPASAARLRVTVSASQYGRIVARDVVTYLKDRDHYRLSLLPGRYVITASGSGDPSRVVLLHPGERVTVNFPNLCD